MSLRTSEGVLGARTPSPLLDRGRLARDLGHEVRGDVRFDDGARGAFANDASIYRQVPVGVVQPRDADDVAAALAVCRRYGAPIVCRGGGTGLAGQSVNAAVVLDFAKHMHRVLEIDPEARTARVQPGVITDHLREAAAAHGLTFGVDPATHDRNTLGGMIGNNSCGTHSVYAGKTVDNVLALEVITYDGTRLTLGPTDEEEFERVVAAGGRPAAIYTGLRDLRNRYADLVRERYPDIPRRVSGFNLDSLLPEQGFDLARAVVGSESTCVVVLEATVRLHREPPAHALVVVGYPDVVTAGEHVVDFVDATDTHADELIALEAFDDAVAANLRRRGMHPPGLDEVPEGDAWLLAEYGAETQEAADAAAQDFADRVRPPGVATVFTDPTQQAQVWEVRRSAIEFSRIPGEHAGLAGWEDAAVAPRDLGAYLRDYLELTGQHGYRATVFGHFGQGCMHNRLDLELDTAHDIADFRRFLDAAGDLVAKYGGALSGEHGDGQLRANQLEKTFGPELVRAFAEFKAVFDPDGAMNPGKVVEPYPPETNLREGTDFHPRDVATHFAYPNDHGGFASAVNRCFGVGVCRHTEGGVMCPSFMVTREEEHSTRGRSRLLMEMMSGFRGMVSGADPAAGKRAERRMWRNDDVKHALDLCLACKGCKSDCPVDVDMATYKAEFLAHYYQGRLKPRVAYAVGLIPLWARLGSLAPALTNTVLGTPAIGTWARKVSGIDARRAAPSFAARTFRSWFATHPGRRGGREVLLWPDTFTDHFEPEVAIAAVEVLEDAGYRVTIPRRPLCCGRPLYDYGMLPTAKRWLRRILHDLAGPMARGVPLVALEPSCLAVFRDELTELFPGDGDARRLSSQSHTLAELLDATEGYVPPQFHRSALLQHHCHQHAVIGHEADHRIMAAAGLDVTRPDSGCCGMAGSFGYEAGEKYDVSVACAERVILPEVRAAADETVVLADGFSCRSQIADLSERRPLHLAQVLALARRCGPEGPRTRRPEDAVTSPR
jgi:FAD/FMN-containing dehydrogenase/Fe-S oxidoreductase